MINSSFTLENAKKVGLAHTIPNRVYLNHMMYWPAEEYNPFEEEVVGHLEKNDGWFENYAVGELKKSEHLYGRGQEFRATDWTKKNNSEIAKILDGLLQQYRELACPWYAQYPLDEFFESMIETKLLGYIAKDHPDFRKLVLIFADPEAMTEVAEERWRLTKLVKEFFAEHENLDNFSSAAEEKLNKHISKFAYINRGLATSKPFTHQDIVDRLKELKHQVDNGKRIEDIIYESSAQKVEDDLRWALEQIKPKPDFRRVINQARHHSYLRNRRVEAFFQADYGASFMYVEIAKRAKFNPEWIMDVSIPEMFAFLNYGATLPDETEMQRRFKNYAMVVRNSETKLISDPAAIKQLETEYSVTVNKTEEIQGRVACIGGTIRGRAKVCFNKSEIGKVGRGDILVAQFTTPDFVPAMERAAAIVADQGGLSSHAAIVSRELGVPCVIATQNGTRVIHDNDLLEINAKNGIIKIVERAPALPINNF